MTAIKVWSIHCDLHTASNCARSVGHEDTEREARRVAERADWRKAMVDGVNKDVCPACYTHVIQQPYDRRH